MSKHPLTYLFALKDYKAVNYCIKAFNYDISFISLFNKDLEYITSFLINFILRQFYLKTDLLF